MLSNISRRSVLSWARHYTNGDVTAEVVLGRILDVADESNLAEVARLLPAELGSLLAETLTRQPPLEGVGYWGPEEGFPVVTALVDPSWRKRDRDRIAAYLKAGSTYARWRGFSFCRFRCGVGGREMGSNCLTDGEWVWPEGLAHYVECHSVCLPEEFVASMKRNRWRVPARASQVTRGGRGRPRNEFWAGWGRAQSSSVSSAPGGKTP